MSKESARDPSIEEPQQTESANDPYDRTIPPVLEPTVRLRRSLDDMRRLSEMIKASRREK